MNQGTIGGHWPLYEDGSPVRIGDTVQGDRKSTRLNSSH